MSANPSTAAAANGIGASSTPFEPSKQEPMRRHEPARSTPDLHRETSRAVENGPRTLPTLHTIGSSS
ncbi:hypothetical protein JKF63_05285 [Porcisia hertigi]|uniref:Uncharacterized protein n=1 Tax=Porcisia hertigi TaxID=2761500 RepID=A0A836ICI2_9TRYP|nr:hypothetical protein JKF63_05285 [Porcisia hertigi]